MSVLELRESSSAIKMGSNLVNHFRAKHIDTLYHYVRNKVEEKAIILIDQLVVDGLTKSLNSGKFLIFRSVMRLASSNDAAVKHGVDE